MRTSPRHDGMFKLPNGKTCDLAVPRLEVNMSTNQFQYWIESCKWSLNLI